MTSPAFHVPNRHRISQILWAWACCCIFCENCQAFHHGSATIGSTSVHRSFEATRINIIRTATIQKKFKFHRHHHGPSLLLLQAMEIKIRMVGKKNAEKWLDEGYDIYDKRLKPANINVETIYHKSDAELIKNVNADMAKSHAVVLLDPLGRTYTSEDFSDHMYKWIDDGGSRLSFVIGGAEGLPKELRGDMYGSYNSNNGNNGNRGRRAGQGGGGKNMISLSAMVFTHQFARVVLIEQIYRALEIRKGSGYHK